jgi:hypothetical protein
LFSMQKSWSDRNTILATQCMIKALLNDVVEDGKATFR